MLVANSLRLFFYFTSTVKLIVFSAAVSVSKLCSYSNETITVPVSTACKKKVCFPAAPRMGGLESDGGSWYCGSPICTSTFGSEIVRYQLNPVVTVDSRVIANI